MSWADIPTWRFSILKEKPVVRYAVKVTPAVEPPVVHEKHGDAFLTVRTLLNSSNKLVGYTFSFKQPEVVKINDYGFSLAAAYGVPDTDDVLLILSSPHVRIIRAGLERPVYQVVLRRK